MVDDPGGSAASQKVQVANIGKGIKLDDLAAPDDNTDLNATTGVHGLLPKLGGGTTQVLRADGSWGTPVTYVRKTADESVTSSTVFQDDDHLVFAVGANEVWNVEYMFRFKGATGGDLKLAITYPDSCVISCFSLGPGSAMGTDAADGNGRWQVIEPASGALCALYGCAGVTELSGFLRVLVRNGANAGNIQLQWAQYASSGTATIIYTNSYLVAMRLA